MAAGAVVAASVDQLIALFNARSMDLPDGFFTRRTQFELNGVAFEEMLGRSPDDPLVLMLTRGAAGYRFAAKAVQHALPDARLQRGELTETSEHGMPIVRAQCWLSGHLRGGNEPVDVLVGVELRFRAGSVETAAAVLDAQHVARLREARLRP